MKRIVFIGASIGRNWDLKTYHERKSINDYKILFEHGGSQFDKTKKIRKIIQGNSPPSIMIIKECAVYFPGDTVRYKELILSWIDISRKNNVELILTTVIPVSHFHRYILVFIDCLIKNRLKFTDAWNNIRYKEISAYNDWIRNISKENKINLLDFAEILSSTKDGFLLLKYSRIDGLHINKHAYNVLDEYLLKFFELTYNLK